MVYHHVPYYMASRPRLSQQGLEAVTNNLAQGGADPWLDMIDCHSDDLMRHGPPIKEKLKATARHKSRSVSTDHQWSNGCFSRRSRGLSARWLQRSRACSNAQRLRGSTSGSWTPWPSRNEQQAHCEYGQTLGHFPSTNPVGIVGDYITFISSYISIISPGYLVQYLSIPYYFCGKCRKCHSFWTNFWLSKCRAGLATVVAVCLLAWGICHNAFVSWPWKGSGQVEPLWFVQRPYCGWCS